MIITTAAIVPVFAPLDAPELLAAALLVALLVGPLVVIVVFGDIAVGARLVG